MSRIVLVILALIGCVPAQAQNVKLPTTQGNTACWANNAALLQDCPAPTLKTGAYVALSTDCGNSFALGGNAFYTFTIGVASGFATKCAMRIYNSDTGRGKGIAIIGLTSIRLFPGQ